MISGKTDAECEKVDCPLHLVQKQSEKKLQCAHMICMIWGTADSAHPEENLDPRNFG